MVEPEVLNVKLLVFLYVILPAITEILAQKHIAIHTDDGRYGRVKDK